MRVRKKVNNLSTHNTQHNTLNHDALRMVKCDSGHRAVYNIYHAMQRRIFTQRNCFSCKRDRGMRTKEMEHKVDLRTQ